MRPIQFLLLTILAGVVIVYFRRLRSRVADRLMATGLALLAAAGIVMPDSATAVANLLGVGRGADLVFYLSIFALAYLWLLLHARERESRQKITRLVRALAIASARVPAVQPWRRAA